MKKDYEEVVTCADVVEGERMAFECIKENNENKISCSRDIAEHISEYFNHNENCYLSKQPTSKEYSLHWWSSTKRRNS